MMIMIAVPTYDLFSDKILPKKFYPKRARIALTNCFIKRCCPLSSLLLMVFPRNCCSRIYLPSIISLFRVFSHLLKVLSQSKCNLLKVLSSHSQGCKYFEVALGALGLFFFLVDGIPHHSSNVVLRM